MDKKKALNWSGPPLAAVWRDSILQVHCGNLTELHLDVVSPNFHSLYIIIS
jgi:hypothetical protein